jgi:hypothetical protein
VIEEFLQQDRELKRARIINETAKIAWQDLERFFASGKVLLVTTGTDLIDVACALEEDNIAQVKIWTDELQLAPVSDDQAKIWVAGDSRLWAVVVKPWVLVQEISPES